MLLLISTFVLYTARGFSETLHQRSLKISTWPWGVTSGVSTCIDI